MCVCVCVCVCVFIFLFPSTSYHPYLEFTSTTFFLRFLFPLLLLHYSLFASIFLPYLLTNFLLLSLSFAYYSFITPYFPLYISHLFPFPTIYSFLTNSSLLIIPFLLTISLPITTIHSSSLFLLSTPSLPVPFLSVSTCNPLSY